MASNKSKKSALKVQEAIQQPNSVNDNYLEKMRNSKIAKRDIEYYYKGIIEGNITILAQAITIIESSKLEHRTLAEEILDKCRLATVDSVRIGITGVPGVGKSTFIETFGKSLTSKGHRVAVLAIDPSSSRNKGSILGDKTRMEALSSDKNAFIRPSPSSGSLGGVAQKTRETITLCEAAGFDIILVETVGVGQSEIEAHSMVDFFLLLMLAGAGDELQGIKRGIIEMSDAIFINKADGDNVQKAELSKVQYANALHLFPPQKSGWIPIADTCSAFNNIGIDNVWNHIQKYIRLTKSNGYFLLKRKEQELYRLHKQIETKLKQIFYEDKSLESELAIAEKEVSENSKSPYLLAEKLIDSWIKRK